MLHKKIEEMVGDATKTKTEFALKSPRIWEKDWTCELTVKHPENGDELKIYTKGTNAEEVVDEAHKRWQNFIMRNAVWDANRTLTYENGEVVE